MWDSTLGPIDGGRSISGERDSFREERQRAKRAHVSAGTADDERFDRGQVQDQAMGIVDTYWSGVLQRLRAEVEVFAGLVSHNAERGRENEAAFARILEAFLPARYGVGTGLLIDRDGNVSRQMDIILFEQGDEPTVLAQTNQLLFPVESVVAVVEVKTRVTTSEIADSAKKRMSVAKLNPVADYSLPIFALLGYKTEVAHSTTAQMFEEQSSDQQVDLGIVLDTGMILGSPAAVGSGSSNVFEVGYALVPNEGKTGWVTDIQPSTTMRHTHGGIEYPITLIGSDLYLVDSARALLIFVESLSRLIAENDGRRKPVISHYLTDATRRLKPVSPDD